MDKTIRIVGAVLAVVLLGAAFFFIAPLLSPANGPSTVNSPAAGTVYFFYGEECPHCHEVRPFIDNLSQKYPDMEFRMLETWHNETNNALSVSFNRQLGVTQTGSRKLSSGTPPFLDPGIFRQNLKLPSLNKKKILNKPSRTNHHIPNHRRSLFLWRYLQPLCEGETRSSTLSKARYPDLNLTRLEVYNNATNRERLTVLSRTYGVQNPGVPIIFIGKDVLIGDLEITRPV